MLPRLAADFLKENYLFLVVGVVGGACSDIEQLIIQVTRYSKREQLLEMLKTTGDSDLTCYMAKCAAVFNYLKRNNLCTSIQA